MPSWLSQWLQLRHDGLVVPSSKTNNGAHRRNSSTIPTYSCVGVGGTTHNLELWAVLATTIGPMAGARSIISLPALVIIVQINMPKVRKTSGKRTLPYMTLKGWGRKPQSMLTPVRIRTRSMNSYREAEYPNSVHTNSYCLTRWYELVLCTDHTNLYVHLPT